jgi:putative transposase
VKYAFIRSQREQFRVTRMCEVLEVSRGGYYEWLERRPSAHAKHEVRLLDHIRQVHYANRQAYGAVKTWRELQRQGVECGKHRVARLRRTHAIQTLRQRRFKLTVEHHYTAPAAPDLVGQHFSTEAPDRVWVGDVTFIRTRAGFLYLAILLDLYARRVVGWSMSHKPDVGLVLGALNMALERRPPAGLIHHTDRGALYSARLYREAMFSRGLRPSMGAKGSAYDNAVAESFFSNLKNELVHHCDFANREHARAAIFDYIELFYNRRRLHQALGYRTPDEVDRAARCA